MMGEMIGVHEDSFLLVVLWNRVIARAEAGGLQGSSEPEVELGCGAGCLSVRLASAKGSKAMERCDGRGVGEPQLMLDRGTSVIFVMSRVVLRDAGVHLAAIAMALKLAPAGLDDLCYRLGCRRGNKGEIALK